MSRISSVLLAGGALWCATALCATVASAQDPLTAQLYGSGVHAYFSGNSKAAYESLTAAIDGGSQDPRVFYFRGFTAQRMGRPQEADADFQKGADLEGGDMNGAYPVSKSLERIQGSQRAALEKYRLKARIAAYQRKEDQRQMVYQKRRDNDTQLLRQAGPPPSAAAVETGAPGAPAMGTNTGDLFGEGPRMTTIDKGGPAKAAENVPGTALESDPFGGAAAPAGADPFGAAPAGGPPAADATPEPVATPSTAPPTTAPPATTPAGPPATPPPMNNDADPFK